MKDLDYNHELWNEFYKRLKERALEAIDTEGMIDTLCQPTIRWLNSHKAITTAYCCSGHVDENSSSNGYILLVFDSAITEYAFIGEIRKVLAKASRLKHLMEVTITSSDGHYFSDIDKNKKYPALIIDTPKFKRDVLYARYWVNMFKLLKTMNMGKFK